MVAFLKLPPVEDTTSHCLLDYIRRKGEIPEYLVFSKKHSVDSYIKGVDGHTYRDEGWAANYGDSFLVRIEDINCDEIKRKEAEEEKRRKDARDRGIAVQQEDKPINFEDEVSGVFDSDLDTVIGCEDDYEFDEQTMARKESNKRRAESIMTKLNADQKMGAGTYILWECWVLIDVK